MSKISRALSPFGAKKVVPTAVELFTEHFGIGITDYDRGVDPEDDTVSLKKTEPVLSFVCNLGKGTGAQIIPFDELDEAITAYQEIIDSDFDRPGAPVLEGYVPTYTNIRHSWRMVRPKITVLKDGKEVNVTDLTAPADYVSVRVGRGQGAKPIVVHKTLFPEIVSMLRQVAEGKDDYIKEAWANYDIEKASPKKGKKGQAEAA